MKAPAEHRREVRLPPFEPVARDRESSLVHPTTFDHALARAREGRGLTMIAIHAPVVAPSTIVRGWADAAVATWSSRGFDGDPTLAIAGVGVARELRGTGADRWRQVIASARDLAIHGAVVCPRSNQRTTATPIAPGDLGLARPRFLGGAAFAPGAADRAPWTGFGDAWFVLPRWTYVSDGLAAWLVLAIDETEARDGARWRAELAINASELLGEPVPSGDEAAVADHAPQGDLPEAREIARGNLELWRAQVEAIVSAIDGGACSKIVAARSCSVGLADTGARGSSTVAIAAQLLDRLDARHAECTRVMIRPPNAGALVAATPERLVRRDGRAIRCDALAGTIRAGDTSHEEAAATLLDSTKDRREHDLVVRAIRGALEQLAAEVTAPETPTIRVLRDVLHLHTPFAAITDTPRHVLELVEQLHPTPAVGGTPTRFAIDWIRDHEPVPRGWYASPVGWFDLDGDGEFAVALRSGVVAESRVHLWAGAGIVAGSDPERERIETELKLRPMLGALGVDG